MSQYAQTAETAGNSSDVVFFDYVKVEEGRDQLQTYADNLVAFLDNLKIFKNIHPDIWNGDDHDTYEGIMIEGENGVLQSQENITNVKNFLDGAYVCHAENESNNSNILINAVTGAGAEL